MTLDEFLTFYSINASKIMWLFGAGASRSSGMPSATDIIWDLKRRYYCLKQNQPISNNELSNEAIKQKIQNYLEAEGNPKLWADDEYSHYFKLLFGSDLDIQRNYLAEMLSPSKITINSGYRILSALIAMEKVKIIFTTNFDSVLENAFSLVANKDLHSFALEGAEAALTALNDENYPLYIKMHGDFRYQEMKNLPESLQNNNEKVEQAFVNACSRYGLIVSGYSGRDENIIAAFEKVIEIPNAFPKGLFWMTSIQGHVFHRVTQLIEKAQSKGINAQLISSDTFDSLMGRIWKIIAEPGNEYENKIKRFGLNAPKIDKYIGSKEYPLIRTNAFLIEKMPSKCLAIKTIKAITPLDLKMRFPLAHSSAILASETELYGWGSNEEIFKVIPESEITGMNVVDIADKLPTFRTHSTFNAFLTKALARSITHDKPVRLMQRHGNYYIVASLKDIGFDKYKSLMKNALKAWDFSERKFVPAKSLGGKVPNLINVFWMECVQISLEYVAGKFWLTLVPDIWIEPRDSRKDCIDFLDRKKLKRYNNVQNDLLDAWKQILFGMSDVAFASPYDQSVTNRPIFEIRTTTAYSFRS
jgi:NAD-dependent SIR2 family protein deacetylase